MGSIAAVEGACRAAEGVVGTRAGGADGVGHGRPPSTLMLVVIITLQTKLSANAFT